MRPTILPDDLVTRRIVDAVRAGATRAGAAEAARISRSSLVSWLKKGREGDEPYAAFRAKVLEAEGELETELVGVVKGHSADSWQAAAWLLERKWQDRWAIRRERQAKVVPVSEAEAEELVARAAALHAAKDGTL